MPASSQHSSRLRHNTFFFPRTLTITHTLIVCLWRSMPTYFMGLLLLWKQVVVNNTTRLPRFAGQSQRGSTSAFIVSPYSLDVFASHPLCIPLVPECTAPSVLSSDLDD